MMRYERKKCNNCDLVTLHRIDNETGEDLCLKCNNQPIKEKDVYSRFRSRY